VPETIDKDSNRIKALYQDCLSYTVKLEKKLWLFTQQTKKMGKKMFSFLKMRDTEQKLQS